MEKIIIENHSDLSWEDALVYAGHVVRMGKVSKTWKGKQYCFASQWGGGIIIYATKNQHSDRLVITQEEK